MADTKYDKMSHQELEAEMMRRQLKESDAKNSPVTFKGTFGILWNIAKFALYAYLIVLFFLFLYFGLIYTGMFFFSPKY